MTWLVLSILTAFSVASQDAWIKKHFSRLSLYEMAAYPLMYSLPLLLPAILVIPVPPLDRTFAWSFAASLPLNGVSFFLYYRAVQLSPLSLTIPFLAFTPAFMIVTGAVFLGEMPNIWGIAGILFICLGCYLLNFDTEKLDFLLPFKAICREPGSILMLTVSLIYSFAAVIGKLAILHSSPLFFTVGFFVCMDIVLIALLLLFRKMRMDRMIDQPVKGLIAGALLTAHIVFHGFAIALTPAAYMIAIKRLSILFSLIYGVMFFGEVPKLLRIAGALLMFAGSGLISLKGG